MNTVVLLQLIGDYEKKRDENKLLAKGKSL